MKNTILVLFGLGLGLSINYFNYAIADYFNKPKQKVPNSPSVWIRYYGPTHSGGTFYNNCTEISEYKYLYVGKDYDGVTFDSTIITVNP